mgnify:CR=1 FL=1
MLFDITPKDDRKDFFDRDKEIEKVKSLSPPITLVLGLRRTGKSSLIKVALKEINYPYIYVDLRKFEERVYISYRDFVLELQKEINKILKKFPSLLDFLKKIKGVIIAGNEVVFNWGKERVSFSSLLDSLEEGVNEKLIIVLDEAQELSKLRGVNLLPVFAYAFDNLKRIKFIFSGSEMGLLYDFLKVEDPESPLFGRAFNIVELKPFSKEEAIEFLRRGFSELGIEFNDFEEVYNKIGGIPGWLTYFGFVYSQKRELEESINETLNYAKRLIKKEFENFLKGREVARNRYLVIMKEISKCANWSIIKHALEVNEGITISDSEVYNYLNQLMKHSWIVKKDEKYCPAEPLIGYTFSMES